MFRDSSINPHTGPNRSFDSSAPFKSWPGLCIECDTELQARDPVTGFYYLFCSNECAAPEGLRGLLPVPNPTPGPRRTRANAKKNTRSTPVSAVCNYCKRRAMCADGMYCSGTCVNLAKGKGSMGVRAPPPISPVETTSPITKYPSRAATSRNITNPPGVASPITPRNRFGSVDPHHGTIVNTTSRKNDMSPAHRGSGEICQTPGCALPARVVGKYCTGTHKWLGENGCIFCRTAPTVRSLPFCKPCYSRIVCEAPTIVEVPRDHEKYRAFQQKWLHNTDCPEVRAVYKIVSTEFNAAQYRGYLNRVETKGKFASQGKHRGNEKRRWHGTMRMCNIGDEGVTTFCSEPSCSLCCVMKTSFDLSFFSTRTNFGRFGAGIYTSSTSSKADTYSWNAFDSSNWKAVLLNKVVVGKGYKMAVDNTTLRAPPPGYDSVIAEPGGNLNYDELVVYNNDAIRPSYLVMYDMQK